MKSDKQVLYLVGQYPAINHGYVLAEIRILRQLGFEVSVASVSPPDRPLEQLADEERREAQQTFYLKTMRPLSMATVISGELLRRPVQSLRGLLFALRLAGGSLKRIAYHLAYFAEAILVGHHMRELGTFHVHANFSATIALITAHTFPVTMSFVVHGFGELHDPSATNLTERINQAKFVRSVSRFGRGQMMLACDRSEWSKLIYAPLGIDLEKFLPARSPSSSHTLRILSVGRLAPEKGQALLLEALASVIASGCQVSLRLVGDGPDRQFLERRAAELGVSSAVDFAGWIDPHLISKAYGESDLFVLPSLAEGVPMVLMEAMAMQLACVAPRITGIPELIEHGVSGMLFTVGHVEDMARKILELGESPSLRCEIGKQARERVTSDYDMGANTRRFAELLGSFLNGGD